MAEINHYRPRRQRALERQLESRNLDALVITHLPNVRYLCGFTGSSGVLLFDGSWHFFTDGRYTVQAKQQVQGARVHVEPAAPLTACVSLIGGRARKSKTKSNVGVEAEHVTVATRARIEQELRRTEAKGRVRLVPTTGLVEDLRILKDASEIEQIRAAVQLASSLFPALVKSVKCDVREDEISAELEYRARRAGAEKMSFESIVASGPRSAMPHARPGRERIGRGFVVLDYGVILGGYCSDMTRTVYVGRADNGSRALYDAVLEAQLAGIAAVRAGVEAGVVDEAARSVLRSRKLDRYFSHSLGHGVGIEIHEAPRLAKAQTQKLQAGMIITIEPGAYVPERGGVRIEDMVLVTERGCEVLTPTSKELVVR